MLTHLLAVPVALSALSCLLNAQEIWLLPPGSEPAAAQEWTLRIGSEFPVPHGELSSKGWRSRFVGPEKTPGLLRWEVRDGELYGSLQANRPGSYLVFGEQDLSEPAWTEDELRKFCLRNGLVDWLAERMEHPASKLPLKVQRKQFAKAVSRKEGSTYGSGWEWRAAHLLEIVPVQNPLDRKVGQNLQVRILYRDQPLKDAMVGWDYFGSGPGLAGWTRADKVGTAWVPLTKEGLWLVRVCHIQQPVPDAKATHENLQVYSSSLAFFLAEENR